MIPMTLAEIARAVGGRLDAVPDATHAVTGSVESDSRNITPGGLFVALRGERTDGHLFAAAAVHAGAVAVLAARPVGVPAVVVPAAVVGDDGDGAHRADDPDPVVAALGRLARAVLARLPALTVVGVTGSSGKTSTKDLLAHLLGGRGPTVAPSGSFNNEIGLPLTVLRADSSTRHLVLEYSARRVGDIAALCRIAAPQVGVELNVGLAHVGEFGSQAAIALAKGELVEALPPDGLAVLNANDPLVLAMAGRTVARTVRFGRADAADAADVRAAGVHLDSAARPSFTLVTRSGAAPVRLRLHGQHHVDNALAAAAVALELGMDIDGVAAALSDAAPASRWRMEVTARADGVTVVNDAYNANPASMRAALHALVVMARGGRSWAVLGAMGELGRHAATEHHAVGRLAVELGVSRLVIVGAQAAAVHAGALVAGMPAADSAQVADPDEAVRLLHAELRPGDVVLVKASRAAALERLAAALTEEGAVTAPVPDPAEPAVVS